ncbi:MAG: glycosyltransferase [Pseudomonadota bacterium]
MVLPTPPRTAGGTERVVADLTNALVDLGADVTVFAADGSRTRGAQVLVAPPAATTPGAPASLVAARESVALDQLVSRAQSFDVIHAHTEFFSSAGVGAQRRAGRHDDPLARRRA